ncbi:hypothetical protein [Oceanicaulis sp.]|uniref:hypothetical protein n=1 Tax=Oceanicaulis sp. TaxID=1924941 RepID=UPI003F6EFC9B
MIGFTPDQVRAMSLWDFNMVCEGWELAHTPEDQIKPDFPDDAALKRAKAAFSA